FLARGKIIPAGYVHAVREEAVDEAGTDEAGGAGDKDVLHEKIALPLRRRGGGDVNGVAPSRRNGPPGRGDVDNSASRRPARPRYIRLGNRATARASRRSRSRRGRWRPTETPGATQWSLHRTPPHPTPRR